MNSLIKKNDNYEYEKERISINNTTISSPASSLSEQISSLIEVQSKLFSQILERELQAAMDNKEKLITKMYEENIDAEKILTIIKTPIAGEIIKDNANLYAKSINNLLESYHSAMINIGEVMKNEAKIKADITVTYVNLVEKANKIKNEIKNQNIERIEKCIKIEAPLFCLCITPSNTYNYPDDIGSVIKNSKMFRKWKGFHIPLTPFVVKERNSLGFIAFAKYISESRTSTWKPTISEILLVDGEVVAKIHFCVTLRHMKNALIERRISINNSLCDLHLVTADEYNINLYYTLDMNSLTNYLQKITWFITIMMKINNEITWREQFPI